MSLLLSSHFLTLILISLSHPNADTIFEQTICQLQNSRELLSVDQETQLSIFQLSAYETQHVFMKTLLLIICCRKIYGFAPISMEFSSAT
ncbi:hypothetical protein CEXT_501111 [Caerostris extrusa]|uniref:Secreted protein n=1 Tax=Caerostris extrusa TaxID=172846 RepID=A0AAV4NFY7_CAEEX|nr:hypothetical protein CEXT_501111 [Caerostris extrusa]